MKQQQDTVTKDMFNDTERLTINLALSLYMKTLERQIKNEPSRQIREIRTQDLNAAAALRLKMDELK